MKRKLLPSTLSKTLLAVPAAALMLGAAQAGTTVGLNFQAWYYDSGVTPQMVGYGAGYQTTGFPVTARAFGVDTADWSSTDPLNCQQAIFESIPFGGTLTAQVTAPNAWQSGIGALSPGWVPETVAPGNDEATWGYLDDGNTTGSSPSVSVANLAAKFPNGYVIQTIAANSGSKTYNDVDFTDGVTTNTVSYATYYVPNPNGYDGTVGLSAPSAAFTSDTININCQPKTAGNRSTLAGFIITDQPVVTQDPSSATVNLGDTLILSATTIGLPNGLAYQWQHYGTNLPGANSASFTKAGVTADDAGDYDLVVTNLYGMTTSGIASVTVSTVPTITTDLAGVTGTVYSGANFSQWSVVAIGGQPLYYNWLRNGTAPVGTDSPTLMLSNVTIADNGTYFVMVTNDLGSATSATNQLNVVASPDLYTTDVAQDSPGAYWPLNETSGTVANDYSGLAHAGTNNGGLTLGVNGPRPPAYQGFNAGKTAYQFDGASSFIDCGTGPSLVGTTDFTLEAWVNTTATTLGRIIQQRDTAGFDGEYLLSVGADGTVAFAVYGGGYQFNMTTPNRVNDGNWHYIAAVRRNGTNGVVYIDGIAAATRTSTTVAPLLGSLITYIGSDERDHNSYFNGTIADVAIYPYALSANRITLHAYNGQFGNAPFSISTTPGGFIADTKPVGTLQYGLNNQSTWTNSSTDFNSPAVTRTGVEVFSGNGQITIPANPDFDSTTGTFTFWLRANAPIPGPGSEGAMLVDRRTTTGTVIVLNDAGEILVQCSAGANSFSGGYLPDNNWHNVAVTYDQSASGVIELYVDGQLVGSSPNTAAWSWPTGQEIEIGRSHDAYWKALNGQLDDFRIYNRVLTPTEIASIQSSDALVDTAALKVRYNFDTASVGTSVTWPVGALQSSPTLGPTAVWTDVPGAVSPYPFLPPPPVIPASPALFYRAGF